MAWLPRLIDRLIRMATAKLPKEDQVRFDEEWRSHVNDVEGSAEKIYVAVGFNIAAQRLAARKGHKLGRNDTRRLFSTRDDLYFELASCCPSLHGDTIVAVIDVVVVDESTGNAAFIAATIHRKECPNHRHLPHRSLQFPSRSPAELALLDPPPPENRSVHIL